DDKRAAVTCKGSDPLQRTPCDSLCVFSELYDRVKGQTSYKWRTTVTRTLRFFVAAALAVGVAIGGAALRAQETRSDMLLTMDHWLDWERVSHAQISPDASGIGYPRHAVRTLADDGEPPPRT